MPSDGGAADQWARYTIGPIRAIAFPNFELRNQAIRRHDIHHILIDLDTSSKGEDLIAAWELGSGCGRYWISRFMESQALWWGILLSPKESFSLFSLGQLSQNFFCTDLEPHLMEKTVGELRAKMIPSHSQNGFSIGTVARFIFYSLFGLVCMLLFAPIVAVFTSLCFIFGINRSP